MSRAEETPTKMRAAAIDHFGSPEVIHIDHVPVPKLAQHDVLVRVAIAGVGTWDPEIVSGSYEDVEAKLPTLSTYLGHIGPSSTYWYLTAIPALLESATARLERAWKARS